MEKMIFKSINKVMRDMDAISKNRKNTQQGYSFRGIEDMYNELHSRFSEAGIFNVPRVKARHEEHYESKQGAKMIRVVLEVEYDFYAEDGSMITVGPIHGEGNDSADKATNKAMSAAHKYALIQLLCVPTEDEKDADYFTPSIPSAPKRGPVAVPSPPAREAKASPEDIREMISLAKQRGWENALCARYIVSHFGRRSSIDLTPDECAEMLETIGHKTAAEAEEYLSKIEVKK